MDSVARGYRTTPLLFPSPTAPLQLPFTFRTFLIFPKISGEFFNNFEYKLVNFVTVVVIRTVTTVTTVTVDTSVIRTAMFSMVIIVKLLFRYVCQWYCGYYNQVVALVSLTCHMFTMSPILAKCSFRISEYSVSWFRFVGFNLATRSNLFCLYQLSSFYPH